MPPVPEMIPSTTIATGNESVLEDPGLNVSVLPPREIGPESTSLLPEAPADAAVAIVEFADKEIDPEMVAV